MISIPTYVLLYLPRHDNAAQEAAMKYFLLSVFSSALLLFGFSYLYGLTGTTNIPALVQALGSAGQGGLPAIGLIALVMVVAGLGFRITAVPFHFYAPDVYQGTPAPAAALLAFVPKVAGFVALVRVLGFAPPEAVLADLRLSPVTPGLVLGPQVPILLWILAAATMTLGNILALLQDNLKRILAYSSVAHAGYMLIGLAVAPALTDAGVVPGGVDAVLFYLIAYGAMTLGVFGVLTALHHPRRSVETVDDLAGLSRTHPGTALLMALFLFSLIGIPLTAGFAGKLLLFLGAMGVKFTPGDPQMLQQARLFRILALIGALNAAVGAWYYLRICAAMYLRNPLKPIETKPHRPSLAAVGICAALTLLLGIYPWALLRPAQEAVPRPAPAQARAEP
jgi:NADH-quinone oxidoreductase subunit N